MNAIAKVDVSTALWAESERIMLAEAFVPDGFRKEAERTAKKLAGSGSWEDRYPDCLRATVYAAISLGHELGLRPIVALQHLAVINGRVAIHTDAPLALAIKTGQLAEHYDWLVNYADLVDMAENSKIEAVRDAAAQRARIREDAKGYRASIFAVRRGETWTCEIFDLLDAQRAGLLNKAGPWQQYPQRMLLHRARTYCLRNAFPDALCGLYTKEELGSIEPEHRGGGAPVTAAPTAPPRSVVEQLDALASGAPASEPEIDDDWTDTSELFSGENDSIEHIAAQPAGQPADGADALIAAALDQVAEQQVESERRKAERARARDEEVLDWKLLEPEWTLFCREHPDRPEKMAAFSSLVSTTLGVPFDEAIPTAANIKAIQAQLRGYSAPSRPAPARRGRAKR